MAAGDIADEPPPGATPWTELKQYIDCPKRHWYGYRAGLSERGDRSYPRFRRALYGAFTAAANLAATGNGAGAVATIHDDLDGRFDDVGLGTSGNATILRQNGHLISDRFCDRLLILPPGRHLVMRPWVPLGIGPGILALRPAEVEYEGDVAVTARLHFFKPRAASHHDRPDAALLYAALGIGVRVEFWYPLDDTAPCACALEERRPEALPPGSRKERLSEVIEKHRTQVEAAFLQLQANVFDPNPDEHHCSGCGYQYACPGRD